MKQGNSFSRRSTPQTADLQKRRGAFQNRLPWRLRATNNREENSPAAIFRNRKWKTAVACGACAVLGAGLIGYGAPQQAAAQTAQAPVTLTISTWDSGAGLTAYKLGIKAFERLHPNVKINIQSISSTYYLPKLLTEMANGSAPDLMLVGDTAVNEFVSSGLLENLTPLFKQHKYGLNAAAFYPNVLNIGKINGQQYMVPKDWADESVIYNKAMFQAAKLPLPKPGWTFNTFVRDAVAMTKFKNGRVVQWGAQLPGTWLRAGLEYFVSAYGAHIISPNGRTVNGYLNSPATLRAIEFYVGLYTHHNQISPTPVALAGTFKNVDLMLTKRVAMEPTGPWNVSTYRSAHLNFGVAPMPVGPAGKPMTMAFWAGWAVNKNSPHLQLANELLAFFASQKWASIDSTWAMPALKGPAVARLEKTDPVMKVFFNQAPYVQPLEVTKTLNWTKDVSPVLTNL
ncbi:MAG: ABC transporter substrate-binding protein, partial [Bacilli bacterium]